MKVAFILFYPKNTAIILIHFTLHIEILELFIIADISYQFIVPKLNMLQ